MNQRAIPLGPSWLKGLVPAALVSLSVLAFGCHKDARVAAEKAQGAASAGSTVDQMPAAARPAASDHFTAQQFEVAIKPDGAYKAGQPGQVVVAVNAKSPYHCNPEYPYKLKLQSAPGVKFPSQVVHKDAVKIAGAHATMTVAFTPETPGKKTIAGKFAFSVCSADKCLVEKRDLKLDIDVAK